MGPPGSQPVVPPQYPHVGLLSHTLQKSPCDFTAQYLVNGEPSAHFSTPSTVKPDWQPVGVTVHAVAGMLSITPSQSSSWPLHVSVPGACPSHDGVPLVHFTVPFAHAPFLFGTTHDAPGTHWTAQCPFVHLFPQQAASSVQFPPIATHAPHLLLLEQ